MLSDHLFEAEKKELAEQLALLDRRIRITTEWKDRFLEEAHELTGEEELPIRIRHAIVQGMVSVAMDLQAEMEDLEKDRKDVLRRLRAP